METFWRPDNKKLTNKKRCVHCLLQNRRTYDEAFPFDDRVMIQTGAGARPLLEFELRPVGARRNWRNVLNKQRFEATLRQHRDVTPTDNLGQELTQALQRSIEQQIAQDPTLTPDSTVHFTMQSSAFTHAFQSATFSVLEFQEGSQTGHLSPISRGQAQLQPGLHPG